MRFFKKNTPLGPREQNNNRRFQMDLKNRLAHIRRKLSRGAANIFRMIKTRTKWGNKNLWRRFDKGKPRLPTDKSSGK